MAAVVLTTGSAAAQAPALTDLWRVAGSTLATPPALATGPNGMFWNPAALVAEPPRLAAAVEVLDTPDALAMGGVLATLQWRLGGAFVAGLMVGRIAITDLVRTTTSPLAQPGEIPVHSQVLGLALGWSSGPLALALLTRGHESRLDALRESGITHDIGIRWRAVPGWTLAAATRFLEPPFARNGVTVLDIGTELSVPIAPVWGSRARILLGLGVGWHGEDPAEIAGSVALALADRLRLAWAAALEQAYGESGLRHTLGIEFRAGQYTVLVARGAGLNGLSGTYRMGLRVSAP